MLGDEHRREAPWSFTELEGQLWLEAPPDGDLAVLRRVDAARARTSERENVMLGIRQNTRRQGHDRCWSGKT